MNLEGIPNEFATFEYKIKNPLEVLIFSIKYMRIWFLETNYISDQIRNVCRLLPNCLALAAVSCWYSPSVRMGALPRPSPAKVFTTRS